MQLTTLLLSNSDWEDLFSRDLYEKSRNKESSIRKSERALVAQHSLKYLIALDQPDGSICAWINQLAGKNSPQINSQFPKHQLTALHVAVMKNRKVIVENLILARADINLQDKYGWTPLHHAAIFSDDLRAVILANNPQTKVTNKDGTAEDLYSMSRIIRKEGSVPYEAISGERRALSKRESSPEIDILYSDQVVWSQNILQLLWLSPPDKQGILFSQKGAKDSYHEFQKKEPPQILLKEVKTLYSAPPSMTGLTFSFIRAVADQNLPSYAMVGEYAGIVKTTEGEEANEHMFSIGEEGGIPLHINQKIIANWTRFISDGFPNLIPRLLYNTGGMNTRIVFFIADPEGVKKGSPLCFDYSANDSLHKWQKPYKITEQEKMRAFFKDFKSHCVKLRALENSLTSHVPHRKMIEYRSLEARLLYPFQTPMALVDLVFSKTIEPDEWLSYFDNPYYRDGLLEPLHTGYPDHYEEIKGFLGILSVLNENMKLLSQNEIGKRIAEKIRQSFLEYKELCSANEIRPLVEEINQLIGRYCPRSDSGLNPEALRFLSQEIEVLTQFVQIRFMSRRPREENLMNLVQMAATSERRRKDSSDKASIVP